MTVWTELCQLATDWRGDVPGGGLMAEEKVNGWRCLYFRGIDGKPGLWTRGGMPIEGCDHILYRLRLLEAKAGLPLFIDGELQVDGSLAATKEWCERGWKQGGEKGLFHAFDCLPYAEWLEGGTDIPLHERKKRLEWLANEVERDPAMQWEWREGSRGRDGEESPVIVAPDFWLFDQAHVVAMANRVWAGGGEGLVLKDAEAPYERRRVKHWQKVKSAEKFKLWV